MCVCVCFFSGNYPPFKKQQELGMLLLVCLEKPQQRGFPQKKTHPSLHFCFQRLLFHHVECATEGTYRGCCRRDDVEDDRCLRVHFSGGAGTLRSSQWMVEFEVLRLQKWIALVLGKALG